MIVGLNAAAVPLADLCQGLEAASEAGFQAFEPRIPLIEAWREGPPNPVEQFGLQWLPLNAVEGVFALPEVDTAASMRRACAMASEFGIRSIIAVPGRGSSPGMDSGVATLRRLMEIGEGYGVSVLYEMLGFQSFAFANLTEAYKVAAEAGLPLVLDTFHLAVAQAAPDEIARLPGEAIGLVHLSDALTVGKATDSLADEDRVLPGEGGLPLVSILSAIRATGYNGAVSVEVFHPKYGQADCRSVALDAYQRARDVLREAKW